MENDAEQEILFLSTVVGWVKRQRTHQIKVNIIELMGSLRLTHPYVNIQKWLRFILYLSKYTLTFFVKNRNASINTKY